MSKWEPVYLDAFALLAADNVSVARLVVELQSVGIELGVLALPHLQERTTQLQQFTLQQTVRRTHYTHTHIISVSRSKFSDMV